jgi:hypothetical protein
MGRSGAATFFWNGMPCGGGSAVQNIRHGMTVSLIRYCRGLPPLLCYLPAPPFFPPRVLLRNASMRIRVMPDAWLI